MEAIKAIDKNKSLAPKLRFKGFKEDWNLLRLGELGSFKNGLNKDSSEFGHGSPFVNLMDVFGKSILMESNFGLVNATEKDLDTYNLRKGDVLFIRSSVKRTGVGEAILVAKDLPNTVYSGFLIRFRDNNKELDLNFKSYCFSNAPFRNELLSYATSSANTNINQESLAQIKLHYPTVAEQQKIASFLSRVDEKLQQLTRKKELLEQYKKGVMQQLFSGKLRFKDENGKAFPKWEEKLLGDLIEIGSSKRVLQEEWKEEGVPFLRTREIINLSNGVEFRTPIFISENLFIELKSKYGIPKSGDILATGVGTIGEIYIVKKSDRFYFKDGNVIWFKMNDGLNSNYISQLFKTRYIRKQLLDNASITTVATFTIDGAKKTKIIYPCIQEQKKIADYLCDIDNKIESINKQISQTQTFKKGLLQQMFV